MVENKNNQPLVSVVLPVYNGENFLREAIQSILDQSFSNYELLIINDASTDNSEQVILHFEDSRIVYLKNEKNLGLIGALNRGLNIACGKYIARMDQDDISHPKRFERQVQFMETNMNVVLCGMQGEILQTGEAYQVPLEDNEIRASMLFGSPFIHPVVMIRRETLVQHSLKYDLKYFHAEDYGLWVNLSFVGKLANLPEVGIYYRKHGMQYTKVFGEGNKMTSFNAKIEYLERLGINLTSGQTAYYEKVFKRQIDPKDINQLKELSHFYLSFLSLPFPDQINLDYLKRLIYKKWKVICSNGIKQRNKTYFIFLSNRLVYRFFEPKVHLWFMRESIRL